MVLKWVNYSNSSLEVTTTISTPKLYQACQAVEKEEKD